MQHIEFRSNPYRDFGAVTGEVVPHVDGVPRPDVLRRVERPSAGEDGQPDLAGSYAGLNGDRVRWPSRHYLGEPVLTWFGDGDTVLLGCGCGEWGCWPFTSVATVERETVLWSGYRHGHRRWDYSGLGPLAFDRTQYEAAVRATAR